MKKFGFWIAVAGVAIYLLCFFATPFEPYAILGSMRLTRASFFAHLLLPDEYFGSWLGPDGVFSLRDRLPILPTALLCLAAAAGFGNAFMGRLRRPNRLDELEYWLFSTVVGLGFVSTVLFWFYFFSPGYAGLVRWHFAVMLIAVGLGCMAACRFMRRRETPVPERRLNGHGKSRFALWLVPAVFTVLLMLGGMIPSTDYDVLSYHLAGTRTFFESGRIDFVPHDVYANMPFGTEMLFLWGMDLTGDVFTGALVGKTLIALTTLLTALGIYAFGRRFFTETAGLFGMILYITTPWIVYVSTAGLVDTVVGMYSFFAIYAVTLAAPIGERRRSCLAGFFAGSAAACKYPPMLFVVLPIGVYLAVKSRRRPVCASFSLLIFGAAVFLACGGWYLKNLYYTGNPVYPLCYSIFGDSTGVWTPEVDARWTRAHSPHDFGLGRFLHDFLSVGLTSPWNAPLTIPFCALLILVVPTANMQTKRVVFRLAAWLVFFFAAWWFLTHRIDRFWLAAVPVLSLLAGVGADWSDSGAWKRARGVFLAVATVYCFLACGAPAPGKVNHFLAPLESIRHKTPWAVWFNAHPPDGAVLLVGESKAFLYDVPVVYNSCWNETPLKEIVESGRSGEEFRRRGIAMILVDWPEIHRFRSPGNYGYSEFVQQDVFDRLVARGVLERFCPTGELSESPTVVYRVFDENE